jgi:hypothetical protein
MFLSALPETSYRVSWSSGWHSFVFGMSWVKISAWGPAIPTEVFRVFIQSLQADARTVP